MYMILDRLSGAEYDQLKRQQAARLKNPPVPRLGPRARNSQPMSLADAEKVRQALIAAFEW
jgi:hypothetical protein